MSPFLKYIIYLPFKRVCRNNAHVPVYRLMTLADCQQVIVQFYYILCICEWKKGIVHIYFTLTYNDFRTRLILRKFETCISRVLSFAIYSGQKRTSRFRGFTIALIFQIPIRGHRFTKNISNRKFQIENLMTVLKKG